jgi:dGTPase
MRDEERRGLNLTRETLHGVLKYPNERRTRGDKFGVYATERDVFVWVRHGIVVSGRTLSAEIVNWADDITYAVHDLEDFYRAGLIPLERLGQDRAERQRFARSFAQTDRQGSLTRRLETELAEDLDVADRIPAVLEAALDRLLTGGLGDLQPYRGTEPQRAALTQRASVLLGDFVGALSPYVSAESVEDTGRVVWIDPRQRAEVTILKELIWFYVVDRHELATLQAGQRRLVKTLCSAFGAAAHNNSLRLFPEPVREQLEGQNERARMRGTRDYIASLTEAKAYELHHRLTGAARTTLLDVIPG